MKVRILSSGEIVDGKYFKDMTDEELENSIVNRATWDDTDIFVNWNDIEDLKLMGSYGFSMVYLHESEIEIIEED